MSTTAATPKPAAPNTPKKAAPDAAPDERFWVRYSPHHELPLSATGSLTLHGLVIGLLLFAGFIAAILGWNATKHNAPFETVVVSGGGGDRKGSGSDPGLGQVDPKEAVQDPNKKEEPLPPVEPPRPLTVEERKNIVMNLPKDDNLLERRMQEANEAVQRLTKVDKDIQQQLADGRKRSAGQGGPGSGGGQGTGKGQGVGEGNAPGKSERKLLEREKRMLRWAMQFRTGQGAGSGPEYLAQLRGLGAIIAIPVTGGPKPDYKLVRDLKPGAPMLTEDLAQMDCIYWVDDKPESVRSLMAALQPQGVQGVPSHFVAFMPRKLEEYLYQIEKNYQGLEEDQIFETKFLVVKTAGGYDVKVIDQKRK